jgi:hypothetical protein
VEKMEEVYEVQEAKEGSYLHQKMTDEQDGHGVQNGGSRKISLPAQKQGPTKLDLDDVL